MSNFVFFWGYQSPFSNFHNCKPFNHNGYIVYNSEQAFMLEKALMFDKSMVSSILSARKPAEIKKLGRQVKNYNDKIWNEKRFDIMVNVLRSKFSNPELKEKLLATEDKILVEASPYDRIWGIGLDEKSAKRIDPKYWKGQNLLGKALMLVRDELK